MGLTKIPKDIYDRFDDQFGLKTRWTPPVWALGETWLMIAEDWTRNGPHGSREQVEATGEALRTEGRDPHQLCLIIFAEADIREEAGIPSKFEGYPVYLFVLPAPKLL